MSLGDQDEHAETSRCLATLDEDGGCSRLGVFAARFDGQSAALAVNVCVAAIRTALHCTVHLGTKYGVLSPF